MHTTSRRAESGHVRRRLFVTVVSHPVRGCFMGLAFLLVPCCGCTGEAVAAQLLTLLTRAWWALGRGDVRITAYSCRRFVGDRL